jgi:hypothetical protein
MMNNGHNMWSCTTPEEFLQRCYQWDSIYEDMKTHGYRLQGPPKIMDEISVNIGRHGDLLFNNGRHRLTFAKLLNLSAIPVRITARHTMWEYFKQRILDYASEHNGNVYAPLLHPDLKHIPTDYGHERADAIIAETNITNHSTNHKPPTVLDLGSHWGYFCHRLEDHGAVCTAVENSQRSLYFLKKLRRAEDKTFTILESSVFDLPHYQYDIILALSLFHHFLKTEDLYRQLETMLSRINTRYLYFETHCHSEPQMKDSYMNLGEEAFCQLIQSLTPLNHCKAIYRSNSNRTLYRFWRD